MNCQKINFTNSRKLKLSGLLYIPSIQTGSIIVICHGLSGSKEGKGKAVEMAEELAIRGWYSLLFDFAGNGESEGAYRDISLSGQIDDLNRALDWCTDQGFNRIITQGRSFGGTTAISQAANDKRVHGVCTWAAPANICKLILNSVDPDQSSEEELALGKGTDIVRIKRNFLEDLEKHTIADYSAKISSRPLLVIHGTADDVVPSTEASLIYDSAREPKKLAFIEGADHQFSWHYHKVWEVFFKWLEYYFPF